MVTRSPVEVAVHGDGAKGVDLHRPWIDIELNAFGRVTVLQTRLAVCIARVEVIAGYGVEETVDGYRQGLPVDVDVSRDPSGLVSIRWE